jgi:hypothetical protein
MMDPLLQAIRESPLSYLPEISLPAFCHFRDGYTARCAWEGKPHDWQYDRRRFWSWLAERFKLQYAGEIGDQSIVCSFSKDDEDAFHYYFALLEQFLELNLPWEEPKSWATTDKSFVGTMKEIRERPPMYFGTRSFRRCFFYLAGDDRAYRDLHLPPDEGRVLFEGFKNWIETKKNRALPRPWYKIVRFWSGSDVSALETLFDWLDEYTEEVGQPNLFRLR